MQASELPELDLEAFRANPESVLDSLRPRKLVRSARGLEVISYSMGYDLLADPRVQPMRAADFSRHGATDYICNFVNDGIFLFMEPERHARIKRIFSRGFGGRPLAKASDAIAEEAEHLAERIAERGEAELLEDFTLRLSIRALCKLVGYRAEDVDGLAGAILDLRRLVYVPMKPHVATIESALRTLHGYALELVAERRGKPQDDLLSLLIAENDANGLSEEELVWGTVNLLLGGIDTTNFQMASVLLRLIQHGLWDAAANDVGVRESAIEETTRMTPVSTMLGRVAHETVELDGFQVPAGTDIKINMVAAGRDPDAFEQPHVFRIDRRRPYFPMIFGKGVHMCIGRNLAMLELRAGLAALTTRIRNIEMAAEPLMSSWTDAFYGPQSLPVRVQAR